MHDDEIAEINLRARHREEGQRYCVLGGVTILECPESTNLKSAKFWSNVATNMQYTPRLRPFGRSSRSKIWNSPLESCSFWAQKYANSPLTFGGASQGLDRRVVHSWVFDDYLNKEASPNVRFIAYALIVYY